MMMKKPAVKKISDLKDKLDAYRASALAARKGPARLGNLALASAAAGGAALAVTPAAEAVLQYSGPQNILVTNKNLFVDVDGDGVNNFIINHAYTTSTYYGSTYFFTSAKIFPRYGASIIASGGIARALSANYNIANTLTGNGTWNSRYPLLGYRTFGDFPGAGNKYIGVQFTNAGTNQRHFGWIQVNLAAGSTSITIVDWAWEDTPDTPIPAGSFTAVIPTLNEWGIIVLMTLLAGAAAWKMNKPELLQA